MYILTLLTLLLTTALAVPNPYYGPEPSETLLPLSTILSPIAFPSSIASRSSNSSTTRPSTTTVEPIAFSSSVWSSGFLFLPSPSAWSLVSSTRSIRVSSTRATSVVVPTPTATAPVVPRQKVGVYICSDANWLGYCHNYYNATGTADEDCTVVDGKASSMGPERGFVCWVYSNAYCRPFMSDKSDMLELTYPGESNLVFTPRGNWNDRVYSYHCLSSAEAEIRKATLA